MRSQRLQLSQLSLNNMEIIPRKHTLFFLAALLVVLLGIMAYVQRQKNFASRISQFIAQSPFEREVNQIQEQSESDEVDAIEEDIEETDLSQVDKELKDIERELNQAY